LILSHFCELKVFCVYIERVAACSSVLAQLSIAL
jgi:hypothetical protein